MKKIICLILLVMFAMEPIAFAASSPQFVSASERRVENVPAVVCRKKWT